MIFFRKKAGEPAGAPAAREIAAAVEERALCPHGFAEGTCPFCAEAEEKAEERAEEERERPAKALPARPPAEPAPQEKPAPPAAPQEKPAPTRLPALHEPLEGQPLFVKLDRYKEVLAIIEESKNFIRGLKQVIAIITELEGSRDEAMRMLRVSLQRLEQAIQEIDSEFVRPVGYEPPAAGEIELKQLEESMTSLQRGISSLRREVEALRAG